MDSIAIRKLCSNVIVDKSKKVTDLYAKITCIKILKDDIILFVRMIILTTNVNVMYMFNRQT